MERKSNALVVTCAALAGLLSFGHAATAGNPEAGEPVETTPMVARAPWAMPMQVQHDQAAWDAVKAEAVDWSQRARRVRELHEQAVTTGDTRRARMFEVAAQAMTHQRQARMAQLQRRFGAERVQQIRYHLAAAAEHAATPGCGKTCDGAFESGPRCGNQQLQALALARAQAAVRHRVETLERAHRRGINHPRHQRAVQRQHDSREAKARDMLRQRRAELRAPGAKGRTSVPAPKVSN